LRKTTPGVIALFVGLASLIAPVSLGDTRAAIPPGRDLDGVEAALLVGDGIDKLLSHPSAYYDAAILYPDRHQLRTTEPFLGFALIGAPLRLAPRLSDVDIFKIVRWLLVFVSLTYAYLFFRALGVSAALSSAGAALCWSLPPLFDGIERLQVLSIPSFFAVAYHAHALWTPRPRRVAHQIALFIAATLYPLCGMINATICVLALILVLPSLVRAVMAADQGRLPSIGVPLVAAVVVDAFLLAPWLLDRSDLGAYMSRAFLQIKHWSPTTLPGTLGDYPDFFATYIGAGLVAAAAILATLAVRRRSFGPKTQLWPLLASAALVVAAVMAHASGGLIFSLQLLFHAMCWATLFAFWGHQLDWPAASSDLDVLRRLAMVAAGAGAFLCLFSFGPVYSSNDNPLANHVLRALLVVWPPLEAIREFDRLWTFGLLGLATSAIVHLAAALRARGTAAHATVAVLIIGATVWPVATRPLVASVPIEPRHDIVEAVARSRGTGGIYVHPLTEWNTLPAALMMPTAKAIGRPIVDGYLGIEPPWYEYAATVLRKFPDPESMWLLSAWKVDTVVTIDGDVTVRDLQLEPTPHPSRPSIADLPDRSEAEWRPEDSAGHPVLAITIPRPFQAAAIEVHFPISVVDRIPPAIGVYMADRDRWRRINDDASGTWLESLAADALIRRSPPTATIRLTAPVTGRLQLDFGPAGPPAVDRIALLGRRDR